MNERVVADATQETPDKLVQFPREAAPHPARRSRYRTYRLVAALVCLLLVAAAGAWWNWGTSTPPQYTMAEVTRGPIARTVTATGTVNPELTIIVGTYVSGVIQELYCDYNTVVKKGQFCAKIDPRPYQTIVDQSRANLAVARAQLAKDKANLTYTKVRYERTARLVQTNATSQDAVDAAKSNYEQAQAQILFDEATIQQRQAMLDAAQVNLDYTNIVSPVDGIVVSRNVTVGQTVAASFQTPTLFLIATDLTKMQVDTNVSESDIGGIKLGDTRHFHRRRVPQANLPRQSEPGAPVAADGAERRHLRRRRQRRQFGPLAQAGHDRSRPDRRRQARPTCFASRTRRSATHRAPREAPAEDCTLHPAAGGAEGANGGQVWVLRDGQPTRCSGRPRPRRRQLH